MGDEIQVSLIQMTSSPDMADNISFCQEHISAAAKQGSNLIVTPEMTNVFEKNSKKLFDVCFHENDDPYLKELQNMARQHNVWLLIGSMALLLSQDKLTNRSFLISPSGEIVARYDKLHMFDATFANGERYEESKSFKAGDIAVLAQTPLANIGMSICYDLRFPVLYQKLAKAGANILAVPSAFTKTTGKAHWHTLLRARAIETGCFVLAPAQVGSHVGGRETYGHSLIVNPWGEVVCDGKSEKGVLTARLNLAEVKQAREKIPCLKAAKNELTVEVRA